MIKRFFLDEYQLPRIGRIMWLCVILAAFLTYCECQIPPLKVITDETTGIQYVSDRNGGLTPRLDQDGNAMVKEQNNH